MVRILTGSDIKSSWLCLLGYPIEQRKDNISLFSGPTSQDECTCGTYKSCNWSQQLIEKISELPQGSQSWSKGFSFFRDRICERKSRYVYCCSGKAPNEDFLQILKTATTTILQQ